ncbi:MAG: DUF4129 domain-containing protein [Desulfobacterales bacterium]|nr:MAG: DUF4129 domain-containing protein [Desulfobacterales bacterium]
MRAIGKQYQSTIQILEEAVHLLRLAPSRLLPSYYVGSLPFTLGLLYFWGDMSRRADANDYCAVAAGGLALLFVWMKCWQTVFAHQIQAHLQGRRQRRWSLRRIASLAAVQTMVQSTGFFVLPAAALLIVPWGWCYAFYQNATVQTEEEGPTLKRTCRNAWDLAKLWPRQNHILLGVLSLFGGAIFLNLAIAIFVLPHLLKSFLGIDSVFTLSGLHTVNTTFWMATLAISYLCLDPCVKTVYALRCFYGMALKSGVDLKTELNRIIPRASVVLAAVVVLSAGAFPAAAAPRPPPSVTPEALNRSIEEVLQRRDFTWRMPREKKTPDEHQTRGPIAALIDWTLDKARKGLALLVEWVTQFFAWLESLLPQREPRSSADKSNWMASTRTILILFVILLSAVLVWVFWRSRRRRRMAPAEIRSSAMAATPDLTDESLTADELPAQRWLALAEEYTAKASLRLAMRALYLATLARLAEHQMITLENYKSNREYALELQRRAHARKDLLTTFAQLLNQFEQVWYGMYPITRPVFDDYAASQQRIMHFAPQ